MQNRIPKYPGRIKLTAIDAANGIYDLTRADEPEIEGTPLAKKLLDFAVAACGVTAGTSTAYTLDGELVDGFTLSDGAKVNFKLHVASGANATLNVDGTGAKAVRNVMGEAMLADIPAGTWMSARYSETFDAYVVEGSPSKVAGGSYLGDGTGKVDVTIYNVGQAYGTNHSATGGTPREIAFPFAPNVVLLYVSGRGTIAPIYQGDETLSAEYVVGVSTSTSTGAQAMNSYTKAFAPVAKLSGNKLKIYGGLNPIIGSMYAGHTFMSWGNLLIQNYSDAVINEIGGYNVTGVKYNYIAF